MRVVKTARGEQMYHRPANDLAEALLARNAHESRFQEARLGPPFCIAGARVRALTREPNNLWLHYTSLSNPLATLPIIALVALVGLAVGKCEPNNSTLHLGSLASVGCLDAWREPDAGGREPIRPYPIGEVSSVILVYVVSNDYRDPLAVEKYSLRMELPEETT
jgi:hypothetical protein